MRRKGRRELGKERAREKAGKEKEHHGECRRTIKNNGDRKEYGKRKSMKVKRGRSIIGRERRDIELKDGKEGRQEGKKKN